jgi:hypothetical protein
LSDAKPRTITLNAYQRANLLWLIRACGYPSNRDGSPSGVPPFTCANTGDWLGEVYGLLGGFDDEPDRSPNQSLDGLRKSVAWWFDEQKTKVQP